MNKKIVFSFVVGVSFGVFITLLFPEKQEKQQIKKSNTIVMEVLESYYIVSFKKTSCYYEGLAVSNDGCKCDLINFTSEQVPHIGKAEFETSHDNLGKFKGWILYKQEPYLKKL